MYINTMGLVLRETKYKESSKILTVLTAETGKLTVSARGAMRKNSKLAAATQLLVFSEMTLFHNRDRWTLTEARSFEQFTGLRYDIEKLALGSYIAELAEAVADEDSPNPDLLPLCLNTLYALSEDIKEIALIKPAFELRLMAITGYTPLVSHCEVCGNEEPETALLNLTGGTIRCEKCSAYEGVRLSSSSLQAVKYIISCDPKKLLSFNLKGEALRELSSVAEGYLLTQLDRKFRTLEFFKGIQ